jgi:hypothetical protein
MKAFTILAVILVIIGFSIQEMAAQSSYPFTFRGGGNMRTWLQETENPPVVKVNVQFEPGTRPAGEKLHPGQGSWHDRGMRSDEPNRLVISFTNSDAANKMMRGLKDPDITATFNCYNTGEGYLKCSP